MEQAEFAIGVLLSSEEASGFALTSHPATNDGHVLLWFSVESAEMLVNQYGVQKNQLEETE